MKKGYKNNLNFTDSKKFEKDKFKMFKGLLAEILQVEPTDIGSETEGTELDRMSGIDFYFTKNNRVYGVSWRYRSRDYDTFTVKLSNKQGEEGTPTEWEKWAFDSSLGMLKAKYHIQVAPTSEPNTYKVWVVNINEFVNGSGMKSYTYKELKDSKHYEERLEALEFNDSAASGVYRFNKIWYTNNT